MSTTDSRPDDDSPTPLGLGSSDVLGPNAQAVARWYCVSREGIATLCKDQEDAQANARHCDKTWPAGGPHRAVQLVGAAEIERMQMLARRSSRQLRKWADWYGSADHAARGQLPLPPAGDVELAEDISAALGPNV